jgi:PAS domain S-box-containing protein
MKYKSQVVTAAAGAAILLFLYVISLGNYLLFHTIAETFSIVIAFSIFVLAWNSRRVMENSYLLFVGIAYLFVGGIDLLHTLAYTGMGVFPGETTDFATQLWISARYMESFSLLIAPFFLGRRIRVERVLLAYLAVSYFFVAAILHHRIFPTCFVEGVGLTPFKKVSEYVISLILVGAAAGLLRKRAYFDRDVLRLLLASIALTIASELAFTFYVSAYGLSNLIGHFFKVVSFYLIYKAIIETGLRRPYNLLFRELKHREEALRESEERYRAIFENTGTATLIVEDDTTISLVNSEFENLTGYSKEEVEGKRSWHEFVAPEDLSAVQAFDDGRRHRSGGVTADFDFRIVVRDGLTRDVHMRVSSMPGTTRIVASLLDITERNRAEEIIRRDNQTLETIVRQRTGELLDAHRRLEEAKRLSSIGTLAATVAHELRNPLSVISTAVLNIRRKSAGDILESHLANIEKKIAESDGIISNLLRYSNIKPPTRRPTSLHNILSECMESTARRFPESGPEVVSHIDAIEGRLFEVDAVQITEIIENILNNAYQAVDETGRIEVGARFRPDGGVEVTFRDNGPGIDEATLAMVFEPFFTTRARGTGLGLTICRELARLHGGDIVLESSPGAGTLVVLTLLGAKDASSGLI